MPDTLIAHVSDTAFGIAHYRALETQRPDALFHDPLAGLLAGDRGQKIGAAMPASFMKGWPVVIRTCVIDDYIRLAIAQGVDTVLNLGAGLDTRPYRMEIPEPLVWIEIDYPHIITFKEEQLSGEKPRCQLQRVRLDLADVSERRKVLASIIADARVEKMLVLTEGVVPYLSMEEAASLADDLKMLPQVRYWIVDYFSPAINEFRQHLAKRKMRNAPFKFTPEDWFGFFREHGWRPNEIRYLAEEGERLGRPAQLPLFYKILFALQGWFASRRRRAAFMRLIGYVLLEPTASGGIA